jgi:hypothetical protein
MQNIDGDAATVGFVDDGRRRDCACSVESVGDEDDDAAFELASVRLIERADGGESCVEDGSTLIGAGVDRESAVCEGSVGGDGTTIWGCVVK